MTDPNALQHINAVQHINVKIFIAEPASINLADAVPVFHRWIRESLCAEMLVDVADYRHVPAGPGVMLIGHEANYSLDNRENRLGLLYNRKAVLEGSLRDRLQQAHGAALAACKRLESDPAFGGKLKFEPGHCEVFANDRLLAPNTEATWLLLKPELEKFFSGCSLERRGEPRDLLRVEVTQL